MKTLTNITSANVTDDGKPSTAPLTTISGRFGRRSRQAANGWYFESTAGAQVFIPIAEINKLVEANEPLFAAPQT